MVNDYDHIGALIRERRESLGWSQAALAERIGTSPAYISQIESGQKSWPRKYINALSSQLGVTLSEMEEAAGRRGTRHGHDLRVAEATSRYDEADDSFRLLRDLWDDLSDDKRAAVLHYARFLRHESSAPPIAYSRSKRKPSR